MKNKCTLLIDGNWLLLSRFAVVGKGFGIDMPEHAKEYARLELQSLMARSISIVLNKFPLIDNIIFVSDGGSWRKQLPIPKSIEHVTYKGNRSQTKEYDWKYIYGALTDLTDQFKSLGVTVSNHSAIEGDDWIWYWSRRLNAEGTSCVIWSSDNDLKQLIQTDQNTMAFTAWYNERNGTWVEQSLNHDNIDDLDFFMQPDRFNLPVLEALKQSSTNVSYLSPDSIVMEKIICGDNGDNIKSIARINNGKRTYKVSIKIWNEIKDALGINTLNEFFAKKTDIINYIKSIKKFVDCNIDDLSEMFDYNTKLVWLNEKVIPETIILYMNQLEYKLFDVAYIKSNFKTLCKTDNSIEDIFNSI